MRHGWLAVLVLTAHLAPTAEAASFPPSLRFRSLAGALVSVHYPQGLEDAARQTLALATEILKAHEARYGVDVGRVQIVLADTTDDSNGFATPFPYPLVHIQRVAPDGADDFGNHDGWLRLVLTHELAHIVHLEQARGALRAGRKVFGRAPFLFPNTLTPTWLIEGLATYEETEGTAFGRGRNPDVRMVLRMASLEGDFPGEDRATYGLDRWPGGNSPYFFGEAFVRDLTQRFGSDTLPRLAREHAGRVIPYADELTSSRVTGASFNTRWREWRDETRRRLEAAADSLRARGLTPSSLVTARGIRQTGPRFSPDGSWIAYTSRTLTRYGSIRLARPDGSGDHELASRNGGTALSWTPDGRSIVFDEPEVRQLFTTVNDLRVVDLANGRVRELTHGLRARDPDVAPDGASVVFVRELGGGSELALIGLDGAGLRMLSRSNPGTEWSGPRWSPDGRRIAASRLRPGGWLDIVTLDPLSGDVVELTNDRAKDVEPAWTPDGTALVFRSDRDGISNLYGLRLADHALLRVTNVLGGAFAPDVAPDGASLAFASYAARGYDIHVAGLDMAGLPEADPFADPYPDSRPDPEPAGGTDHPYRPLPSLWPRFWTPFVAGVFSGETRYGVASGGFDPLLRHAYGFELHRGSETGRVSFQGVYQYDRWRPTFLLGLEDTTDPEPQEARLRTRQATLQATLPIARSFRVAQSLVLAYRREREVLEDSIAARQLDLAGVELAWVLSSARQFPYSISPVEGWRLRLAYAKEAPGLGSDVSLGKLTGDARAYTRVFGESDALALRWGGGTSFGEPGFTRSFAVGGFPDGSLFDLAGTNLSVLRGYPDGAFMGRSFAHANVEYRLPLAHPQRGVASFPVFVRHLHGAVFADAGNAWTGRFRLRDVKTGVGVALGTDLVAGHALPLTLTLGVARGLAERGETRVYFRSGLAF